jgi:hypothetical protein
LVFDLLPAMAVSSVIFADWLIQNPNAVPSWSGLRLLTLRGLDPPEKKFE